MRLAIVGSSVIPKDFWYRADALMHDIIMENLSSIEEIISGGAPGIDSTAEFWADHLNIPKRIHYPKFPRWEPDGFKARNILIAEDCTHLLCIRYAASKTYGSGWTADYAKKLGKVVWRYEFT